jgi:hypothetical protein
MAELRSASDPSGREGRERTATQEKPRDPLPEPGQNEPDHREPVEVLAHSRFRAQGRLAPMESSSPDSSLIASTRPPRWNGSGPEHSLSHRCPAVESQLATGCVGVLLDKLTQLLQPPVIELGQWPMPLFARPGRALVLEALDPVGHRPPVYAEALGQRTSRAFPAVVGFEHADAKFEGVGFHRNRATRSPHRIILVRSLVCRMDSTVRQALIAVEGLLGHVPERPCFGCADGIPTTTIPSSGKPTSTRERPGACRPLEPSNDGC